MPSETEDTTTTDQYTKIITKANNQRKILEKYSRACEESCVQGMSLMQPYLDYTDDPLNGTLDLKVWSYNSFLVDPYFKEPDMSDANFVWCQQYISKQEADARFPDSSASIAPMAGTPQRYGNFYFLPENYNMARNDLLVLSYVWYKWKRKRKKIFIRETEEMLDFSGSEEELAELQRNLPNIEVVEVTVPSWKLAVVLNDQLMWQGFNPLGFDNCPFVPVFWNYDPQISYPDLRVRSLTRSCRDAQFLLNRRIILNHDISESSINSGWLRREDAISNPENLRYGGQGKDIIVKNEFSQTPMNDIIQKIQPNAVPPSDLQLADQLVDLIYRTTGVSVDNLGFSEDKQMSGLSLMLRQGAGLVALQKYFDQWDVSLQILGDLELKIVQNNWSAGKVARMLGEEPSPNFFLKMYAKYHVVVAEGLNTVVQQQQQFSQLLELDQMLGGNVIPKHLIIKHSTLQGKTELIQAMEQQQQQQQAMQQESHMLQQAIADAKLKELYSKAALNIASARERHGRNESNIGLFEERLSEVQKNEALSTKAKMEALEKLIDVIAKYGEVETALQAANLASYDYSQDVRSDMDKIEAKKTAEGNKFLTEIMASPATNQPQQQMAMDQEAQI